MQERPFRENIDWLILTAANAAQGRGYGAQLRAREERGSLPMRWMIVADPMDRRAGSGGSTFAVLFELAKKLASERETPAASLAELFEGQRILIVHSGGDSRRLPAYAAQGKIFAPLPCDVPTGAPPGEPAWREADLFDLILDDLLGVPLPQSGRVFIGTGDVMLGVARHRPRLDAPGVVGVAFPTDVDRGSRHGVYVRGEGGRVVDFLQKPTGAQAAERGAVDESGRVLVDSGLVSLDPESVEHWLHAAGVALENGQVAAGPGIVSELHRGWGGAIDLYDHIFGAIPERVTREAYLDEMVHPDDPEASMARQRCGELYDRLHGQPFSVTVVPDCEFLHIGSSRELLETLTQDPRVRRGAAASRVCVFNSDLARPPACKGAAVIEACAGEGGWRLGGDNIVVGIPAAAKLPPLPKGWGVVCLPVGASGWAAALFGHRDDAKTPRSAGGTIGNAPIDGFLRRAGLKEADLWSGNEQTLWTARLWTVGDAAATVRSVSWMLKAMRAPAAWKKAKRVSFAELLGRVNQARMIEHREALRRTDRVMRLGSRLGSDPWLSAASVVTEIDNDAEARGTACALDEVIDGATSELTRARLFTLGSVLRKEWPRAVQKLAGIRGDGLDAEAFSCVARAVAGELTFPKKPPQAKTLTDQVVWVTTPVRIDFHGGWSDTPPVCNEVGGRVVNAAITLNGQYPVQVMARVSDEPRIRLSSVDLGRSVSLTEARAVCAFSDPHDWAALPKSALVLAGVAPSQPRENLKKWLERFGGGLDLTIFAALPKGSGLGTSSVLGAAILACLDRVLGRSVDVPSLIRRTSLLEQMMSTAGGWQDQAGGITPGVKLLSTEAGPEQVPRISATRFDGAALAGRMLLYYTGQRRLAKNILQNVVWRYLARDPRTLAIIERLKEGAEGMRADLQRGDAEAFARGVLDFWECKKGIDPGATNPQIEAIIKPVADRLSGYELPGAGGGGFVFMIAKDVAAAGEVREMLTKRPPNKLARFYDFAIDQKGLAVSVL
jgi:fucokinase